MSSIFSKDDILSLLDAELSSVLHGTHGKVMFTIQSGEPASLSQEDVSSFFSSFGKLVSHAYVRGRNSGVVTFSKVTVAKDLLNKVLVINNCTIHIIQCFSDISAFPVPYQILIESKNLPRCWEKHVIVKNFFNNFGEVTGVYFIPKPSHYVQRLVVSFKEDKAKEMTFLKVLWDSSYPVFVREVSCLTLD